MSEVVDAGAAGGFTVITARGGLEELLREDDGGRVERAAACRDGSQPRTGAGMRVD